MTSKGSCIGVEDRSAKKSKVLSSQGYQFCLQKSNQIPSQDPPVSEGTGRMLTQRKDDQEMEEAVKLACEMSNSLQKAKTYCQSMQVRWRNFEFEEMWSISLESSRFTIHSKKGL